jgi:hypothetical protein
LTLTYFYIEEETMGASQALNAHIEKAPASPLWVWFTGATALLEGQGVCYDFDSGTATAYDGKRINRVELPSQTNNRWFAGVAARPYAASAGGQLIEIYGPGSTCNILSRVSNTLGVGRTTCIAGGTYAGYFDVAGFEGKGSAVALQTVNRSVTAGKCMARLEEGPESGLIEYVDVVDNDAVVCMVGGVTVVVGAAIGTGDCTFVLADGALPGQKKAFLVGTAVTSNDFVITVTSGIMGNANADPSGALSTITMNAANEEVTLVWGGIGSAGVWAVQTFAGATIA